MTARVKQAKPAALEAALAIENWVAEFEDLADPVPVAAVCFMSDGAGIKPLAVVGGVNGFSIADFAEGFLGVHEQDDESVDWGAVANEREQSRRKARKRRSARRRGRDSEP